MKLLLKFQVIEKINTLKQSIQLENSLACKTKLNEYVLSMHGLSGRKSRILLNSLIEKFQIQNI